MSDVTIDQHGELYRHLRAIYDARPDGVRRQLGDLHPDALHGIMACAQAEQHDLYDLAAGQLAARAVDPDVQARWDTAIHRLYDTTGETTFDKIEGVDYHAVPTGPGSRIPSDFPHVRGLCAAAWNMVHSLGAEDPSWAVEDIRDSDDPRGLALVLGQMLSDVAHLVDSAVWGEFVRRNGGVHAASLPQRMAQIEQERDVTA